MRFQTSSTSPYLQAPFQRRLLAYGGLAVIVLIALQWMTGSRRPAVENTEGANAPSVEQLDFNVREAVTTRPLEPDEFHSFGEEDPVVEKAPVDPTKSQARRHPLWIKPELLQPVQDNTLGIRRAESNAFFQTLDQARLKTPEQLAVVAEPGVQYLNLMTDPALYRGRPVTLIGEMCRLYEFQAEENDAGLKTLYEAWLFTPDSGTHPVRVVSASLGPELQVSDNQRTPVKVTGYFFKREAYPTSDGVHVAPTILAGRLERFLHPHAPPPSEGVAPVLLGIIVAMGLIFATTLISFVISDRRSVTWRRPKPILNSTAIEPMTRVDHRSVREQLQDLEEWAHSGGLEGQVAWPGSVTNPSSAMGGDEQRPVDDRPVEFPTPVPPTRAPRPPLENS